MLIQNTLNHIGGGGPQSTTSVGGFAPFSLSDAGVELGGVLLDDTVNQMSID